jgi:hypothetical protein
VAATIPYLGMDGTILEVTATRLTHDDTAGAIRLGVEVEVRAVDSSIYDWSVEEQLSPQGYLQAHLVKGNVLPPFAWPWSPAYPSGTPLNGDATWPAGEMGPCSFGIKPAYSVDSAGNSVINLAILGFPVINKLDLNIFGPVRRQNSVHT